METLSILVTDFLAARPFWCDLWNQQPETLSLDNFLLLLT